jgi:hypothetical protein
MAVRGRQEQARLLTEMADRITSRSGEVSEARLQEVQARLSPFDRQYPGSPYAPAAKALTEISRIRLSSHRQQQQQEENRAALVGRPAPAIPLKDLEGRERTFGEYRGKLILLNVFASW